MELCLPLRAQTSAGGTAFVVVPDRFTPDWQVV
jgi:hypothetical protein